MQYYWNERKYNTYEELINTLCDMIYEKVAIREEGYGRGYCGRRYPRSKIIGYENKLKNHYEITAFFKKFRHTDTDGDWHKAYSQAVYTWESGERELAFYNHYPARFEQKPWIVIDSLGRIINSKDLKLDALKNNYDPNWKPVRRWGPWYPPTSYRNGRWQKYAGDHAGPTPDLRRDNHHLDDRRQILLDHGVTFKVRGKRTVELREAADWDGRHGWLEKGWKQTRKKKQWMK